MMGMTSMIGGTYLLIDEVLACAKLLGGFRVLPRALDLQIQRLIT